MFRDGDTIVLDPDEQHHMSLPERLDVRSAPDTYIGLGVVIEQALCVEQIMKNLRPTSAADDDEWDARTGGVEARLPCLIRCREELGNLAFAEIAAAGIEAIRVTGLGGSAQPRLHEE